MNEDNTIEMNEWAFPEVDLGVKCELDLSAYISTDHPRETQDEIHVDDTISDDELNHETNENKQTHVHSEIVEREAYLMGKQEIEQLRQDYESRLSVLANLLNKLKNPASIIDEELIELIQDIVKKISKRIILKEIAVDPSLFSHMINELRGLIDSKNGMITVYLSEQDYQRLDSDKCHMTGLANIDNQLNEGDIVIKSNFAEVRALLDDRIDQLIRIQHD
jgi:flagellar biosynthesis/type III secretory pathway protein FliH